MLVYRVEWWDGARWRHWATYLYREMANVVAHRLTAQDGLNVRILPVPYTSTLRPPCNETR